MLVRREEVRVVLDEEEEEEEKEEEEEEEVNDEEDEGESDGCVARERMSISSAEERMESCGMEKASGGVCTGGTSHTMSSSHRNSSIATFLMVASVRE